MNPIDAIFIYQINKPAVVPKTACVCVCVLVVELFFTRTPPHTTRTPVFALEQVRNILGSVAVEHSQLEVTFSAASPLPHRRRAVTRAVAGLSRQRGKQVNTMLLKQKITTDCSLVWCTNLRVRSNGRITTSTRFYVWDARPGGICASQTRCPLFHRHSYLMLSQSASSLIMDTPRVGVDPCSSETRGIQVACISHSAHCVAWVMSGSSALLSQ